MAVTKPAKTPERRPAETAGVAGAAAILVAHVLGVTDATVVTALAVVLGVVPAAVTWLVTITRRRQET